MSTRDEDSMLMLQSAKDVAGKLGTEAGETRKEVETKQ
jgi:hypothetical protein